MLIGTFSWFSKYLQEIHGEKVHRSCKCQKSARHKEESPFYEFMAVTTSWKGPSNFPHELKSGNPA
jgi:hypothetical protein